MIMRMMIIGTDACSSHRIDPSGFATNKDDRWTLEATRQQRSATSINVTTKSSTSTAVAVFINISREGGQTAARTSPPARCHDLVLRQPPFVQHTMRCRCSICSPLFSNAQQIARVVRTIQAHTQAHGADFMGPKRLDTLLPILGSEANAIYGPHNKRPELCVNDNNFGSRTLTQQQFRFTVAYRPIMSMSYVYVNIERLHLHLL